MAELSPGQPRCTHHGVLLEQASPAAQADPGTVAHSLGAWSAAGRPVYSQAWQVGLPGPCRQARGKPSGRRAPGRACSASRGPGAEAAATRTPGRRGSPSVLSPQLPTPLLAGASSHFTTSVPVGVLLAVRVCRRSANRHPTAMGDAAGLPGPRHSVSGASVQRPSANTERGPHRGSLYQRFTTSRALLSTF